MAKMYQVRFRLGLLPRPSWGAYSVPADPLAGFKGLLIRGGEGRGARPVCLLVLTILATGLWLPSEGTFGTVVIGILVLCINVSAAMHLYLSAAGCGEVCINIQCNRLLPGSTAVVTLGIYLDVKR